MNVEQTASARAMQLIREAFPNPIAEYVAIVVHGPVRYTNPRFEAVVDSVSAALARQSYISQVVSVRTIGESTFVSADRHTTFLIAALTPASTSDVNRTVVPDLRETVSSTLQRLPHADGFDVKVTGNPALDYDVRTISAEDTRHAEERALPATLVVLVLAFGALVAATLPIIVGVLAITIALGIVAVAAQVQTIAVFVLDITTMGSVARWAGRGAPGPASAAGVARVVTRVRAVLVASAARSRSPLSGAWWVGA